MTTVYERTRSVIETGAFLARLSQDVSLPDNVRGQARQLLRHYPNAEVVRLAGRCEAIRQDEISRLSGNPKTLHPALATWPLLDPFFCDFEDRDTLNKSALPALIAIPKLKPVIAVERDILAAGFRVWGLAPAARMGCLSVEHRCFASAQMQVLSRATVVLGDPGRASSWLVSRVRGLDRRQPCTLMHNADDLILVMDVLTRIENRIF